MDRDEEWVQGDGTRFGVRGEECNHGDYNRPSDVLGPSSFTPSLGSIFMS